MLTRSQIESLTREELIEELLQISDISCQLKALDDRFDTFAWGFRVWFVDNKELQYSSAPMNNPVRTKFVNNAQYHRRESLEVNPVSHDIGDNVLEEKVRRAISLTGHEVIPDDLHPCHRLKNEYRGLLKFKEGKLKHSIQINKKVLQRKSLELSQLKFLVSFSSARACATNTNSWLTNVAN